jgi:hypothetical protein
MYLLLALGIVLVVLLVGGAFTGFAAGFIDGFQGNAPGTTDSKSLLTSVGAVGMILCGLCCFALHMVFIRFGYASYSVGRIPKEKRWQVVAWLMMAMGGVALLYSFLYNPLAEPDGTLTTAEDETVREAWRLLKENPITTLLLFAAIEATADLVIFGGVLREILEWKHRPQIVIPVFGGIMAILTGLFSNPLLIIPDMMVAMIEGWVYEYSRSIIPVIIGDVFYWVVMLAVMGIALPWWVFIAAGALIIAGAYFTITTMEPYKPID